MQDEIGKYNMSEELNSLQVTKGGRVGEKSKNGNSGCGTSGIQVRLGGLKV